MTVVILGSPTDGFTIYGPFDDSDSAIAFADKELAGFDWWVTDLVNPEGVDFS